MTFAKTNYANWAQQANQDRITTNVWLTRKNNQGLFNAAAESSYTNWSPTNTEWAYGTTADLPLTFRSWHDWSAGNPAGTIGSNAVLHIISDDIYIDIKFTSFTGGNGGGGFSYERAGKARLILNGAQQFFVLQHDAFTDPSATANDSAGNPLTVDVSGTVDTDTLGSYMLTYTATDGLGFSATTNRIVQVVTHIPQVWNGRRLTFTKQNGADWTQPANQDRITTNVWLTRQDEQGLFNMVTESGYGGNSSTSPLDTEWAYGTTSNILALTFMSWYDWVQDRGGPPGSVGCDAVLHLISEDIYIDIKFTSWTASGNGGGFSYERAGVVFVTLNGDSSMIVQQYSAFTDPGTAAVDTNGNPLAVTTNGVVDTDTLGNYGLTYSAADEFGNAGMASRTVTVMDRIPKVWNGPRITFTKADYADWTDPANQDRMTPNVWLTRQDDQGLFNIKTESSYDRDYNTSPSDTEWAYGTTANLLGLDFMSWRNWARTYGGVPEIIGRDAVVHLISEDIYIDIKFTSWTSGEGDGGGGVSYERARPYVVVTLNGLTRLYVLQGGSFTDPGATAADGYGNPLVVNVTGTVDTGTLGNYTLTYAATDGSGHSGNSTRMVSVVTHLPQIWNGRRTTFTKQNGADWTQPANQDQITTNVWLTRQDEEGLFNIVTESGYGGNSSTSPLDTEWAYGTTANFWDLTFMSWHDWARTYGDVPEIAGRDAVLHLISEDIYIDIKFTSWTSGDGVGGGGFSYERAGVVFVTLNGDPSMMVLLHNAFVDPGATAVDTNGNPLVVTTNGVVDTETPGSYTLIYSASNEFGNAGTAMRTVAVMTHLPQIWNGPRVTFTKANYADWTQSANQDRITPRIWLTRGDQQGPFNVRTESSYDRSRSTSPADTEWAYGTTANFLGLSFMSWREWARTYGDVPNMVGRDAVLHLISEDIYIDIKFTSWTSEGNGGGFSYERAKAFVVVTLNGGDERYVLLGGSFSDPGATAVDINGNPLTVDVTGTVDTGTVGTYVLSYSATDGSGHTAQISRSVHVVSEYPPLKACMMPSYNQQLTYANAVLNEPIMVWGRAWGGVPPYAYTLDFGDGSTPAVGSVSDPMFIGEEHTYTSGGSKTVTLAVTDGGAQTQTRQAVIKVFLTPTHDMRVNMAVEKGLIWIYRNQTTVDSNRVHWASSGDEYDVAAAGVAVLALEENGHLLFNNYETDIYAETVQKGLNWLVDNGYGTYYSIYPHSDGIDVRDSDSNGNGKGAYLYNGTYANAIGTAALILSQPTALAASNTVISSGPFTGVSYFDLVEDIFDQYSFCQGDGSYRGGWRYRLNEVNAPAVDGGYDGSAQQWPNINFVTARDRWGLMPAPWVITNSVYGFQQVQNANGACGYSDNYSWLNVGKSGGMLTAYKVGGKGVGDDDVNRDIYYIGQNWLGSGWAGDLYAMYGCKKGLHLQEVDAVPTPSGDRNWYNDMSAWLLGNAEGSTPEGMPSIPLVIGPSYQNATYAFGQAADGSWISNAGYMPNQKIFGTSVSILILTKTVTVLSPVAVIASVGEQPKPQPGHLPTPFAMDGSGSYHQDPGNSISEYLWDWDAGNGLDWDNPDATGSRPVNPGYNDVGAYTVTLRVKDNSTQPQYSIATLIINVTDQDVAPVAVAIPPGMPAYAGMIGEEIVLDGSASYDPDGDSITNYTWDLNGNGVYGDAGDISSADATAAVSFASEYVGAIGLQVAANGKTGTSLSQVDIFASSNDLSAVSLIVSNVVPGVSADLRAVFMNNAGSARDMNNVVVRFYNGNPLTSGSQISSNYLVNLPRGLQIPLDAHIDNLSGVDPSNIYVYVDANMTIPEWNELNNTVVAEVLVHVKTDQAITFALIPDQTVTNVVGLAATASSGFPVGFAVNSGPATITDGTNVVFSGPGIVTIVASQAGDADWNPAPDVTNTFNVLGLFNLTIQSSYGTTEPVTGVYSCVEGNVLTNGAISPDTQGTTQYVCAGWIMTGNEPASGVTTSCVMTVTNDAVLTWLWTTNYWLGTAAGSHGSVDVTNGWNALGATVAITANADQYYHFTNWSGDVSGAGAYANPLNLLVDGPKAVTAGFAATCTTNTDTPHWWLAQYGLTNDFEQESADDPDGDGVPTCQEWVAGTDPTNSSDYLKFDLISLSETGLNLDFKSHDGRLYAIEGTTNVMDPNAWTRVTNNIPGNEGVLTVPDGASPSLQFYRIRVRLGGN
jgi:hypothetical protein